ncbi:MAG: UvrD-helicase domain-containing protein [Clostridia bacterium]|nr:UvrD-helicase domain-containing protein [Clostridia bacterium]
MGKTEWSKEQLTAINDSNHNLLVSAAAGSGKTTLLIERVKTLILDKGVGIDEMLIVTFTNAAANEMKTRLRDAIYEALAGDISDEKAKLLKEQLSRFPRAQISTFSSFGKKVARENFQELGIDPGVGALDETQEKLLKNEILEEIFESYFEKEDERFKDFLRAYSSYRNEDQIREAILKIYDSINNLAKPWEFLHEQVEMTNALNNPEAEEKLKNEVKNLIKRECDEGFELADKAYRLACDANVEKAMDIIGNERQLFLNIIKEIEDGNDLEVIADMLANASFARLTVGKADKEAWGMVADDAKAYRTKYKKVITEKLDFMYMDWSEHLELLYQTKPMMEFLEELLLEFEKRYREGKADCQAIDFSDMEHLAYQALCNKEIADEYRRKFKYIFVDEYQDTSNIEDEIINLIKRENNTFYVGDIKQSIYFFRSTDPQIFQDKLSEFGLDEGNNKLVKLNTNYRSKSGVIQTVNKIFEKLIPDYINNLLNKGVKYEGALEHPTEFYVLDGAYEHAENEIIEELIDNELEAVFIAKKIEEMVGKLDIYDMKLKGERKLEYRDIVILARGIKSGFAPCLDEKFRELGIPLYVEGSSGYFESIEISIFLELLKIIDNRQKDIPLVAVLRSELFDFEIQDLVDIRLHNKGRGVKYYDAFVSYCKNGSREDLKAKCNKVMMTLDTWKSWSEALELDDFLWKLLIDSGYYTKVGLLLEGAQRQANLRLLVETADRIKEQGVCSLSSYIDYVEAMKKRAEDVDQAKLLGEDANVVRLMTIHKSKGLEFPVVFLARACRQEKPQTGGKYSFHSRVGLGLHYVNQEKKYERKTIFEKAIDSRRKYDEHQEYIRLLYVATTRAKDKLIIVGSSKKSGQFDDGKTGEKSFAEMLSEHIPATIVPYKDVEEFLSKGRGQKSEHFNLDELKGSGDEALKAEVQRRMDYVYPYEEDINRRYKRSVSDLNKQIKEAWAQNIYIKPGKIIEDGRITAAEKGSAHHAVMEHLSFKDMVDCKDMEAQIQALVDSMEADDILRSDEAKAVQIAKLKAFFESDLGKRACQADLRGQLKKEKAFTLKTKDWLDREILTQGIIDCFFEEDGKIILLDYKTNYVDKSLPFEEEKARLIDEYKVQIKIYKEALEKATGKEVAEAYLFLTDVGQAVRVE